MIDICFHVIGDDRGQPFEVKIEHIHDECPTYGQISVKFARQQITFFADSVEKLITAFEFAIANYYEAQNDQP